VSSIYYPYFRGKQFELIAVRENAHRIQQGGICPIIEPVRESLSSLRRTIESLHRENAEFIIVANPMHGDHAESDMEGDGGILEEAIRGGTGASLGYLLREETPLREVQDFLSRHVASPVSMIHYGFADARGLSGILADAEAIREHIFIEDFCPKLYQRSFRNPKRVLVRDGFKKRRNREYPSEEMFSELHLTYLDEGMGGFGDFLMVGDEYSEAGGPAWAVAIHLSYLSPDREDLMMVRHFVSDRIDTPTDPGGKYLEALRKLVAFADAPNSPVLTTEAMEEFRSQNREQHFPGLGYVKKLSMQHHMDTLAEFLSRTR